MALAKYDSSLAYDQVLKRGIPGQVAKVVDAETGIPVEGIQDLEGRPIPALVSNSQGYLPPFQVENGPSVVQMQVGSVSYILADYLLVGDSVTAAQDAAAAAQQAASLVEAPADEVVATLMQGATLTQTAGDARWVTNEGADSTVASLLTSPSATWSAISGGFTKKSTLIDRMRYPVVVAHRGSQFLYPEQSLEGMRASAADGFAPEVDVQFLSDNTMVCLHDNTVDRTMTGRTGNVAAITPEQWLQMRIKPAVAGGRDAQPYFFDQYLDELGGSTVLVPELKQGATQEQIDLFIEAIKSRSLEGSVICQSFTWEVAVQFASAGLVAAWLFNGTPSRNASQIAAAGIKFCGVGSNVTPSTIASLKAQGIRVIGYTYNTAESYASRLADGVDGVFSNDPWRITRRLPAGGADPFATGFGWPGIQGEKKNGSTYSNYPVALSGAALDLYQHPTDPDNLKWVYMDWAGRRTLPLKVSMRIEFPASTEGQTNNAGFVLYRNSINPDAGYKDAAEPGQQGLTFIARRNGVLDGWAYVDGAAATKIITRAATGEYAPSGQPGVIDLSVTITGTTLSIEVPTHGQIVSVPYSFVAGGPLRFALRGSYAPAKISNVQIVAL